MEREVRVALAKPGPSPAYAVITAVRIQTVARCNMALVCGNRTVRAITRPSHWQELLRCRRRVLRQTDRHQAEAPVRLVRSATFHDVCGCGQTSGRSRTAQPTSGTPRPPGHTGPVRVRATARRVFQRRGSERLSR